MKTVLVRICWILGLELILLAPIALLLASDLIP